VVGVLAGAWFAVLTALMYLIRDDRKQQRAMLRRSRAERAARGTPGGSDPPRTGRGGSDPPRAAATASAERPDGTTPRLPEARAEVPLKRGPETRIGMMDPALMRTQIGGTPAGLLASAGASKTQVVPKNAGAGPEPVDPKGATQPVGIVPPEFAQGPSGTQRLAEPPGTIRGAPRVSSDPPARAKAPSDPPAGAERPSSNPPRIPVRRAIHRAAGVRQRAAPIAFADSATRLSPRDRRVFHRSPCLAASPGIGVELMGGPETRRYGSVHYTEGDLPKTISPPPPPPSRPPRTTVPTRSIASSIAHGRRDRRPSQIARR